MTKGELVDKLKNAPDDTLVFVWDIGGVCTVHEVRVFPTKDSTQLVGGCVPHTDNSRILDIPHIIIY